MKILFASWELDPIFKVGGLADVARSLPLALIKKNIEVKAILPYYSEIKLEGIEIQKTGSFEFEYKGKKEKVNVYHSKNEKTTAPFILLESRKFLSSLISKPESFAFFDLAICEGLKKEALGFDADIVHGNDWHAGLIPLLVRKLGLRQKTILTIHNIAHQGIADDKVLESIGIRKSSLLRDFGLPLKDKIDFLKISILLSNLLNTVSPTYAKEILTKEQGFGLEGVLDIRKKDLYGVLNGVDYDWLSSLEEKYVKYPREEKREFGKNEKRQNKKYLQQILNLETTNRIPLVSYVGRLDPIQKGIDIIYQAVSDLKKSVQFVILGTGDPVWEKKMTAFSKKQKNVRMIARFDNPLAQQIYASSDFVLVPSKYEPCGLVQMIAMYYGAIPIVRKTGGLADTVKDNVNGFVFDRYSPKQLEKAIKRAVKRWKNHRDRHEMMIKSALKADFSWDKSAEKYIRLYKKLLS